MQAPARMLTIGFQSMKFAILVFLGTLAVAQNLPDAPNPQQTNNTRAGFFSFRQSWRDPPLRTNRQTFTSKTFLIFHCAFAASVAIDIQHTHGARENWASEGAVIPAVVGLDYLMDRFFTRAMAVEAPIYGIVHYSRDAVKGSLSKGR